ncbi:MAG: phytanoyl-CoA dioxygenase family protein, partial [Pseudomonadota bacterium]
YALKRPVSTLMDLAHDGATELQQLVDSVYDSPPVVDALTAVLGRGYAMDASPISVQSSSPGRNGQQWHKGQVGKRRFHEPRFLFGYYYPQRVTLDMGPTAVCARSQYLICTHSADPRMKDQDDRRPEEGVEYLAAGGCGGADFDVADGVASPPAQYGRQRFVTLEAGDVLLVHYDAWHRGTPNVSSKHRILFEKYFHRVEEPGEPTWKFKSPEWRPKLDAPVMPEHSLLPLWLEVWNWMLGVEGDTLDRETSGMSTSDLAKRLRLVGEPWIVRLPRAAYGSPNAPWIAPVSAQIENIAARAGVNYAMPAIGTGRGPTADQIEAAQDLSPAERMDMIRGMVAGLSDRLATEGGPVEDWAQLISALGVLGDMDQARAILVNAREVFGDDPSAADLLSRTADRVGLE